MLILECLLDLTSMQGDVTCAFLHAHLPPDEQVYMSMPRGFTQQYDKRGKAKVLKLKRTFYGLKQSPTAFWKYMARLVDTGVVKVAKEHGELGEEWELRVVILLLG